jgi:MYXO-CTERM domain-containing protein
VIGCDPLDAGSCASGTICSGQTIFSAIGDVSTSGGVCVVGCLADRDCTAGSVCSTCEEECIVQGNSQATIGGACAQSTDCPSGGTCFTSPGFLMEGYCTQACVVGTTDTACSCPGGSVCSQLGFNSSSVACLQSCPTIGEACGQSGFLCQPGSGQGSVCVSSCQVVNFGGGSFDTCGVFSPNFSCNTDSGVCAFADGGEPDAGIDAGPSLDSGDSGVTETIDAGIDAGGGLGGPGKSGSRSSGCSSSPGTAAPDVFLGIVGLIALVRRRRG